MRFILIATAALLLLGPTAASSTGNTADLAFAQEKAKGSSTAKKKKIAKKTITKPKEAEVQYLRAAPSK